MTQTTQPRQRNYDALLTACVSICLSVCLSISLPAFAQEETADENESGNSGKNPTALILEQEKKHTRLLAAFFKPGVAVWIKNADKEFLGLYEPALRGQAHGVVLLLHDAGQHPNWQGTLSTLREYLPEKGWSTLSITLPNPESPKPPPPPTAEALAAAATSVGTAIEDSPGANESKEVFNDQTNSIGDGTFVPSSTSDPGTQEPSEIENIASDRIIAAVDYLQQQQVNPIVIYGQGLGATRAAAYVQETGGLGNSPQAFIMVDAYNTTPRKEYDLLLALNNPSLPIIDIQTTNTTSLSGDAKSRLTQARRNELDRYQQVILLKETPELLAKRIYGFLTRSFK